MHAATWVRPELYTGASITTYRDHEYVMNMMLTTSRLVLPPQHPAHEGRFREAILKAERDVASTAAGNRGHEKPGTAASP